MFKQFDAILGKATVAAVMAAAMIGFNSCSEDNNSGVDDGGTGGGNPGAPVEALSPEDSKAYMESVAKDVMGCFDPQDQASTITLCKYFVDTYGNLDEPEEWELDSNDNDYFSARKLLNGLYRSVVRRDAGSLTRAVNYVYDFERFSGVYEPGQYCWVRTADSDDIVFKFRNAGGVVCVATAKGSGGESSGTVDGYTGRLPKNVKVTLTEGTATHLDAEILSDINEQVHTATAKVNASSANIVVSSDLNATDTRVTNLSVVTVSGRTLVKANAVLTGHDMCNRSVVEPLIRDDMRLYDLVDKGEVNVDVLGRLQFKGNLGSFGDIADHLDAYYDSYDDLSKDQAQQAIENDCKRLNADVNVGVYYSSSVEQAKLRFQPELYEDDYFDSYSGNHYYYWDWSVLPVLYFTADGTTYDFESYFGNSRFSSVESQWDILYNSYKNLWK